MFQKEAMYHRGEQHRIRKNLNLYIFVQQIFLSRGEEKGLIIKYPYT